MEITNELLAAYSEGKVSNEERDCVRHYLTENPEELESIMLMMDEDYDLDLQEEIIDDSIAINDNSFSDISYSSAAFSPQISNNHTKQSNYADRPSFEQRMDELLDELHLI